jgi:hypothetical protein
MGNGSKLELLRVFELVRMAMVLHPMRKHSQLQNGMRAFWDNVFSRYANLLLNWILLAR